MTTTTISNLTPAAPKQTGFAGITETYDEGLKLKIYKSADGRRGPAIFITQTERAAMFTIKLQYDAAFVDELKRAIPGNGRKWIGATSTWMIEKTFTQRAKRLIEKHWNWPVEIQDYDAFRARSNALAANAAAIIGEESSLVNQSRATEAEALEVEIFHLGRRYDQLKNELGEVFEKLESALARKREIEKEAF